MNKRFEDIINLKAGCGSKGLSGKINYIFLYGFVAYLKPKKIIEIGTASGVSAITMALALKENGFDGHIYTCDVDPLKIEFANQQAKEMKVDNMITAFVGTSDDVEKLGINCFPLGFIDGKHTYEAVKNDFNNLRNICDYILFHDIQCCKEVDKFFREITNDKIDIINKYVEHFTGMGIWKKND